MNSRKKKREHNDIEPECVIDSVLSKAAVDVSAVTAPDEARKSKKNHKNRQTELEEGAESCRTVTRTADDPENIELHPEMVKRYKSGEGKKKKETKEEKTQSELNDCPDKADLPGIEEQTERKLKSKRPKTDGESAAVEGSGRKKNHSREISSGTSSCGERKACLSCSVDSAVCLDITLRIFSPHYATFIPNVESKSVDQIHKMIKYDLDRFKEFRRQGLSLRSGRFNAQENERLMSNVNDFLAVTGIQSAFKFHERIAEGIPRSWHQIYIRGRKMFDGSNYKGR
uniref:Uncharacterized protein n=1 Tax=Salmo trutta TaxID=8032 RepID=A0A673XB99_SALTR